MQTTKNANECINWIEESISREYYRFYEQEYFSNVQRIGTGGFGKVYRANWKNSDQYLALKSFFNLDDKLRFRKLDSGKGIFWKMVFRKWSDKDNRSVRSAVLWICGFFVQSFVCCTTLPKI
ncbi:hypothetical protein RhiirA5_413924 [Rhizophagus irregularis]|uniref:Protein kinase domain-containing protein n=1 Tax=Rhizophagus irregularis TaxID=588596 RepID=A0A2N0PVH3_9GLOM|nr:hypothetical protein RhiirA5_413924 [Rhizophagus irregularis]